MANIILERNTPIPANPKKSGEYYDSCPQCSQETDHKFKAGGRDSHGTEHRDWSTYVCDLRSGGCGMNWARTTAQGAKKDHAVGRAPKWPTQSAAAGRVYFTPSEEYQRNYDRIFRKGQDADSDPRRGDDDD